MSFILDALKKSETERQQSNNTEFAGIPSHPESPGVPRWLWIVGLLLAVNLAVLLGVLLRPGAVSPETVVLPTAVETSDAAATTARFEDQIAAARQNRPLIQEPAPANQRPPASVLPHASPDVRPDLISQDPASVPAKELYPTIQEIRASGTVDLPELHLDIHVFSDVAADRFAFINMAKLREGSQLQEGPEVVEITAAGVLLRYRGQTFLVPRE